MKEVVPGQQGLEVGHLDIVDRYPPVADDPSSGVSALNETGGDKGIHDRVPRCHLCPLQFRRGVTQSASVQDLGVTLAEESFTGGLHRRGGLGPVHQSCDVSSQRLLRLTSEAVSYTHLRAHETRH